MAASDYLEQNIVDFVLNGNTEFTFTTTASVYLALYTAAPSDSGGGTEITGVGNYTRKTLTQAFDAMTGVTDGITANTAEIAFPQATGTNWGLITAIGIFDAATTGNLLYHGSLDTDKQVDINDTFKIAIGDLQLTLS